MNTEQRVLDIVSDQIGRKRVSLDDTRSTLGLDSLDEVETVIALEEEFDCEIPDEAAEGWETIGDIVRWITDSQPNEWLGGGPPKEIEVSDLTLKPCPFCGAQPDLNEHVQHEHYSAREAQLDGMGVSGGSFARTSYSIECSCGTTITGVNDEFMVRRWNRRAT